MGISTAAQIAGVAGQLGTLEQGRSADLLILERQCQDPFEKCGGGRPVLGPAGHVDDDLADCRGDRLGDLVDPADRGWLEPVVAWGTPMPLDTDYRARPPAPSHPPTLAQLRAALIAQYPGSDPTSRDNTTPVRPRHRATRHGHRSERPTSPLTVRRDLGKRWSAQR